MGLLEQDEAKFKVWWFERGEVSIIDGCKLKLRFSIWEKMEVTLISFG